MRNIGSFIILIILLIPGNVVAASSENMLVPVSITVLVEGQRVDFNESPVMNEDALLLPLRDIAESLDIKVEWRSADNIIILSKNGRVMTISLDSAQVCLSVERQLFYMEQVPVVSHGYTLVSVRFIDTALGARCDFDQAAKTLTIEDTDDFASLAVIEGTKSGADDYYQLYDIVVGPVTGPNPEEARNYVLNHGLLNNIEEIRPVYLRFDRYGDAATMVAGADSYGQERLLWLVQDKYRGDIELIGLVSKDSGLSEPEVLSILLDKGFDETSVLDIYAAPYTRSEICWYVLAVQGDQTHCYCFDFITGDQLVHNMVTQVQP